MCNPHLEVFSFFKREVLPLYIFLHGNLEIDRLVGHHEAFADLGFGPVAHLSGSILDFTNDEASSVPVRKSGAQRGRREDRVENMLEKQH